jgi:hypothetical protein
MEMGYDYSKTIVGESRYGDTLYEHELVVVGNRELYWPSSSRSSKASIFHLVRGRECRRFDIYLAIIIDGSPKESVDLINTGRIFVSVQAGIRWLMSHQPLGVGWDEI